MKQSKRFIFFTFLLLSSSSIIMPVVDAALKSRIDKASPMGLYQVLEGAKIVAFSKDFLIKDGLSDKDLKNWNDVTDAANELVKATVQEGKASTSYVDYVEKFKQAATFFKDSVDALHDAKYSSAFTLLKSGTAKFEMAQTFSPDELKKIKDIADASLTYKLQMLAINREIFKQILQGKVPPKSWAEQFYTQAGAFSKGGELKDADDVLRGYKKIIKNYELEKDFKKFLEKQKIDKKNVGKFLTDLEGIKYIMKAKLLAQVDKIETQEYKIREHNVGKVEQIIEKIHENFPDLISPLEFMQLAEADKISLIIFAQSGVYADIFGQLYKEATFLYNVAKNNLVRGN